MNGKAEKTRGAKVRASRAKSRVEAKKKSRAASRAQAGGGSTSAYAGRRSARKPSGKRDEPLDAAPARNTEPRESGKRRREERSPEYIVETAQERPLPGPPAPVRKGRKRKKERHGQAASTGAKAVVGAMDTAADTATALRAETGERVGREKGKGGSAVRTALLGGVLVASLAILLWVYTGTGVLNVKRVEFRGNEKLQADYLRALTGIGGDTHLLKMDVKAVESALLSEPYIARADITRHYPNTVEIEIVERRPSGYVLQNGKYALIDQEGMVLESVDAVPPGLVEIKDLALPLLLAGNKISGAEFASVTSLIGSLPQALREKTAAAGINKDDGLYIMADGTTVIYGEADDFSRKNAIALMALSVLVPRYGAIEYIDVSYPEHPVIKPYGAA
jgi:cell division protein FtsQ